MVFSTNRTGEGLQSFPSQLHKILSRPEFSHIITWMPHGRSWKILLRDEFEYKVLPLYFKTAKYSSFRRQISGWGYRRITAKGADHNSYYHKLFLRSMPHLSQQMRRRTGNDNKSSQDSAKDQKSALLKISSMHPLPQNDTSSPPIILPSGGATNESLLSTCGPLVSPAQQAMLGNYTVAPVGSPTTPVALSAQSHLRTYYSTEGTDTCTSPPKAAADDQRNLFPMIAPGVTTTQKQNYTQPLHDMKDQADNNELMLLAAKKQQLLFMKCQCEESMQKIEHQIATCTQPDHTHSLPQPQLVKSEGSSMEELEDTSACGNNDGDWSDKGGIFEKLERAVNTMDADSGDCIHQTGELFEKLERAVDMMGADGGDCTNQMDDVTPLHVLCATDSNLAESTGGEEGSFFGGADNLLLDLFASDKNALTPGSSAQPESVVRSSFS